MWFTRRSLGEGGTGLVYRLVEILWTNGRKTVDETTMKINYEPLSL